jgi:flagellar hook-associated protein 1 FlgK
MGGIGSTLSIAKTAIAAQQYGLNVTGQNIANVNNPDYSVQTAEQNSRKPALYSGFLFGTGVDTYQIRQSVDQLLEQRLTNEQSTQASFEEQESYMRILEGFFDENSDASIRSILTEFWNSWHDLSDNPLGSSERVAVFENGIKLASRFEAAVLDMDGLVQDITSDVSSAVTRINSITSKIADLNNEIVGLEINRSANDQRDQRNRLLDELGELIDIETFEKPNGAVIINAANGFTIVNGVDTYELRMQDKNVAWRSSFSGNQNISDRITGGRLGGLLEMRDAIIPKYRGEIDELAREMIWALNYQHSQGVGLEYFNDSMTGDYATDESGWLSGYEFGDKIDYSKDFTIWTEDKTFADTQYTKTNIDMGISQASISNWQGTAPGSIQSIYKLTVVDDAVLGDRIVTESDGDGLGLVHGSTGGVSTTLSSAIADQVLTVYGGSLGTVLIDISDAGGNAKRSAASIAELLNNIEGVAASASENSASFDITGIVNAQDGDEIQFSVYVDGVIHQQSFVRNSNTGSMQEQFEDALISATEAINSINEDSDLFANGLTISSSMGRTLGVEAFEVVDNTGIRFDSFANFNAGDIITFTVESSIAPISSVQVSVNLTGVDISDQAAMASAFSDAMTSALVNTPFTVEHDPATHSVILRTTDRSNIILTDAANDTGNNASIDLTTLAGTNANAGNTIDFSNSANTDTFVATVSAADTIDFYRQGMQALGVTIAETAAGAGDKSAVITGTVTALMDPGMDIQSTVYGAGTGGLFVDRYAKTGSSIITLGGTGGFSDFTTGEVISFDVDGTTIDLTVGASTTDISLAILLEAQLNNDFTTAGVDGNYQVIRTGASVSIIKDISLDEPIEITNFSESVTDNANLAVSTGTGMESNQPQNDLLESGNSNRDFSTSTLYNDEGIILWEKLNRYGLKTGETGLIHVEDEGNVSIVEGGVTTLSFDISRGSLVAGNTLTVNTDTLGHPDPLSFTISGQANSINEIYKFRIVSGGKVGHLPATGDEPLVIEWTSSVKVGTFTIEGHDPPYTPLAPVEVKVDGMIVKFFDGTLFTDDVFTITTGDTGMPVSSTSTGLATGERASDWHWTIDSFADQFSKTAAGMKALTTLDNRLKFSTSDQYHVINNIEYSESNGFSEANVSIIVKDQTSLDFSTSDLRFVRAAGNWGVMNDPTGGKLAMLPPGGDDDGFGVDFTGDGLADIEIRFDKQVSGDGYVEFDFQERGFQNLGFAFSDDSSASSGLLAAAGINNFFKGYDSLTMEINGKLSDTKYVTSATINSETGEISQGDNTNALAMADVQHQTGILKLWTYQRGIEAQSSTTNATLDDYFNQMIGSMGIKSRTIKNSKKFADIMVNNIRAQRDSISAVSLDEEMIKLMKYQHAFSAASKLLKVSDEMLNTLIAMR